MPDKKKQYGMVVDTRKCVGCMSCTITCKMENGVTYDGFRAWVNMAERGEFPQVKRHFLPRLCNHCQNPPCVPVCPVKATYSTPDGVVVIDQDRCIGCGYCVAACPYTARYIHSEMKVADKCNFCEHRLKQGLEPACVRNCMGKARIFGDIADPQSEVAQYLAGNSVQTLRPELGTQPKVYYVDAELNTLANKGGIAGARK